MDLSFGNFESDVPTGTANAALDHATVVSDVALCVAAPTLLRDLTDTARVVFGIERDELLHNYHLHRGLRALARAYPPGKAIFATDDAESAESGRWGFAGGTALVSALRIACRYSEDIDLVLIAPPALRRKTLRHGQNLLAGIPVNEISDGTLCASPNTPEPMS